MRLRRAHAHWHARAPIPRLRATRWRMRRRLGVSEDGACRVRDPLVRNEASTRMDAFFRGAGCRLVIVSIRGMPPVAHDMKNYPLYTPPLVHTHFPIRKFIFYLQIYFLALFT